MLCMQSVGLVAPLSLHSWLVFFIWKEYDSIRFVNWFMQVRFELGRYSSRISSQILVSGRVMFKSKIRQIYIVSPFFLTMYFVALRFFFFFFFFLAKTSQGRLNTYLNS
ncbi:hypothetical protein RND81_07G070100 [Saponaria officinalis]|uniref:Uncharacterized protein n=1 Tax=Saponaria officinalis TaxID=3572 RepID=A0AAW1JN72_SAPOF